MTDSNIGIVEDLVKSSAFRVFWERFTADLDRLRTAVESDGRKLVRAGDAAGAALLQMRATAIEDVIEMVRAAPVKAANLERSGTRDKSIVPGYSGIS